MRCSLSYVVNATSPKALRTLSETTDNHIQDPAHSAKEVGQP